MTSLISVQFGCSDEALVLLPEGPIECYEQRVGLEIGEWAMLTAADAICLSFPPIEARYAIAYYDVRLVEQARRGKEQPWPEPYWFDIKVSEGELQGASVVAEPGATTPVPAPTARLAQPKGICSVAVADEVLCWAQPWAVGDQFRVHSDYVHFLGAFAGQTATVIGVNGHLVFAILERDLTRFLDCQWCQGLVDSVGRVVNDNAVPLLESVFTREHPVTSPENGQLLVLLHTRPESQSVGWISDPQFHVLLQVSTSLDAGGPDKGLALALVHELTHAFQRQFAWERDFVFEDEWAKEGGADFMASEFVRRQAGISLDGNFNAAGAIDLQTWELDPDRFFYAISFGHAGEIATGYQHAANMLRDFVIRRYQAGEADTLAIRAVLRGALEGWYGATTAELGDGLSNRMKQRLGQDWDPITAVLTWTLSNAVDDRTPSARFQNPAILEAWNPEGARVSWLSAGTYELGSGNTLSVSRKIGSTGYINVEDSGTGGLMVLRSDRTMRMPFGIIRSGVRWAVIRYQ
ncbi:MAG: hypothetical protein JSW51_05790 [Gemmatimonadota bacterium]|nr:MAG: hypothetical protein JSW51_05790 [Gemmatimonadota bacterium]